MRDIFALVRKIAHSRASVLITGESGTGKDVLARTIHFHGNRARQPFLPINCTALPEGLLESELFGHVRGAFTGAVRDNKGLFQEASAGTIFLDEIGDLTPNTQVKLLRVLQEKMVRPVGDTREFEVDVRVIAATNQDIRRLVADGRFREDLFYRINVLHLQVPPLRERREDIPSLTRLFVDRACQRFGFPRKEVHRDALAVLLNCPWPGNVRELENVIEQAVAMESSSLITVSSLPASVFGGLESASARQMGMMLPEEGLDLEAHTDSIRRELMRQALERCGGIQTDAARLLRMTYRAFRYHADKYKLAPPEE
jgi:transcriptional regulator with GAF, ATPase, and Fis domain